MNKADVNPNPTYNVKMTQEAVETLIRILGSRSIVTTGVIYETPVTGPKKITITYIEAGNTDGEFSDEEKRATFVLE